MKFSSSEKFVLYGSNDADSRATCIILKFMPVQSVKAYYSAWLFQSDLFTCPNLRIIVTSETRPSCFSTSTNEKLRVGFEANRTYKLLLNALYCYNAFWSKMGIIQKLFCCILTSQNQILCFSSSSISVLSLRHFTLDEDFTTFIKWSLSDFSWQHIVHVKAKLNSC